MTRCIAVVLVLVGTLVQSARADGDWRIDFNEAAANPDATKVGLSWTATGDDGMTGRAREYDIRYIQSPIDEGNWDAATAVAEVADAPAEPARLPKYVVVSDPGRSGSAWWGQRRSVR